MLTTLTWELLVKPRGWHEWAFAGVTHTIDSVYPALIASLLALVVVSLLDPRRDDPARLTSFTTWKPRQA